MYARVITFQAKQNASVDQAMDVYRGMTIELQNMDGFEGSTFLMNEQTQRAVAVTYWRDQVCANNAGHETLPVLIDRIQDLVDGPPDVSGYQVIDQSAPANFLADGVVA